jgi:hypothetical protein
MSGYTSQSRARAVRAIGGERNAARAEQLRALGHNDRRIARDLRVSLDAVGRWFDLQDELVFNSDLDGAA